MFYLFFKNQPFRNVQWVIFGFNLCLHEQHLYFHPVVYKLRHLIIKISMTLILFIFCRFQAKGIPNWGPCYEERWSVICYMLFSSWNVVPMSPITPLKLLICRLVDGIVDTCEHITTCVCNLLWRFVNAAVDA